MARIALLLTGQLRTYDLCKHIVKKLIIERNNVDVFMSIDACNKLQCIYGNSTDQTKETKIKEAIEFYKPVDFFVNYDYEDEYKEYIKAIDKDSVEKYMSLDFLKVIFQQYYVVDKAYKMLDKHIKNNNKEYDLVIRLRFDQYIWESMSSHLFNGIIKDKNNHILFHPQNINLLQRLIKNTAFNLDPVNRPNRINVFGFGKIANYNYINDQFFSHGMDLLPIMNIFYKQISFFLNLCASPGEIFPTSGAHIEHIFYRFLTYHKINFYRSNISGIFVREKYRY